LLCFLGVVGAQQYKDWSDKGELVDEKELSKAALLDEEIARVNAANGGWVAGRNTIFEGATLHHKPSSHADLCEDLDRQDHHS